MAAQGNKVQSKRAAGALRITDTQRRSLTEGSDASTRNKPQTPFAWERAIPLFHLITSQKFLLQVWQRRGLDGGAADRGAHSYLFAGESQRRAPPGFAPAQARFGLRNVIAGDRHRTLAFGQLDLKHHHVLAPECR